jgi:hypothetical protein
MFLGRGHAIVGMGRVALDSQTSNFKGPPDHRETFGEVLANGVVIELVNAPSGRQ